MTSLGLVLALRVSELLAEFESGFIIWLNLECVGHGILGFLESGLHTERRGQGDPCLNVVWSSL